ncbi:metallophosphoesterase [Sphingomonas sp.]|uniref:metallophosphoesterase n=1 Tax=Sphingomonas sp. TaxID=28214 RepID=UPI00286A5809|nr:metallophosphoesterase [Sphingomonas sp.]
MVFSRFKSTKPRLAPAVPPGVRAYAIGDVHGRLDLLDELLAAIDLDNDKRGAARTHLVMLGDLIDRGPDSRGVVERLRRFDLPVIKLILLCGNHEEALLRLIAGERGLLDDWLTFGGSECLQSYGLDPATLRCLGDRDACDRIREAIPQTHQSFLQSFGDTVTIGDYLFVHAGIRPGVHLSMQLQRDLRWIRQPFLDDERDHGCIVVHGHTISEEVIELSNRIGLDTGAYRSGRLSAIGLEGSERWFLETGG